MGETPVDFDPYKIRPVEPDHDPLHPSLYDRAEQASQSVVPYLYGAVKPVTNIWGTTKQMQKEGLQQMDRGVAQISDPQSGLDRYLWGPGNVLFGGMEYG